jgi:hypothetical protein
MTQDQVVAAKPAADVQATRQTDDMLSEQFVRKALMRSRQRKETREWLRTTIPTLGASRFQPTQTRSLHRVWQRDRRVRQEDTRISDQANGPIAMRRLIYKGMAGVGSR